MKCPWILGAALVALAGCSSNDNTVEPIYEIDEDAAVVVMPVREPGVSNAWDSVDVGHRIAETASTLLANNGEFIVRPYREVIGLSTVEDWTLLKAKDVAALTGADYVVVAELTHWDPQDDKGVGIVQGVARANVRLFKVMETREADDEREAERIRKQNEARRKAGLPELLREEGGRFVAQEEILARYPETYLDQYGESFLDPDEAKNGLTDAVAKKIAQLFYEHEEPFHFLRGE
ncbi:MAG: hypothetical protein KDD82_06530 [Planctomycetes bacterium]|nr:hypothetical protein [Planctomycetota bacterium]